MNVNLLNGVKQNSYAPKAMTKENANSSEIVKKKEKQEKTETVGKPKLSKKAQEYYEKLKKKFGKADFILVDSSKMEDVKTEPSKYNNEGAATTVFIDEAELEKMANDEEYATKQENLLNDSLEKLPVIKNNLDKLGAPIKDFGLIIEDGKTSIFAEMQKETKAEHKENNVENFMKKNIAKQKEAIREIRKKYAPIKRPSDETRIIERNNKITIITNSVLDLAAAIDEFGSDYFTKSANTGINLDVSV